MGILKDLANNALDNLKGLFGGKKSLPDNDNRTETDDLNLMGEFDTQMEDCAKSRSGYEKLWFTNIAAVLGQQWVVWNDITKKFDEPRVPDWRIKLVCNKILPRYRKALNRLSTFDPQAVVTPNSNETLDIESAQLGTKLLRGLKDKVHMMIKNHKMNQWRLLCGTVFKHYFWNPTLGSEIPDKEEQPKRINQPDEETGDEFSALKKTNEILEVPKQTSQGLRTGDVDCEVWNAFEVYPLDNPSDMVSCRRLMHARYVPIEWVQEQYPETGQDVKPEKDDTTAGMYLNKISTIIGNQAGGTPDTSADENKVLFKRVWERPSKKHPKGRFIAYANKVLLENGDIPNIDLGKEFEIPAVKYDDLEVPGRFWAQATIEQMIPINKEFNRSISQIVESRNLMSKPKWTVVRGTVNKNSITSQPGEVIEWNATAPGAQKPVMETPPSLPPYVIALPDILEKCLGDVGAMHEVSLAGVPPGVKSGKAIRELKQSDEDEMNPLFMQDTENKKIICTAFLKMVQENYTEKRLIKVVGNDKVTDVISFVGADLRSNNDVWVEETDMVPRTRSGRQEMVKSFFDDGLLGDTAKDETRKRAIRLMEYGNVDDIWEDASLDSKQSRYENKELSKGNMQKVEWYDVHSAHILEHEKPIKSPLFRRQPVAVQNAYIKHIKDHDDWMSGIHPENPKANINVQPPMAQMAPPVTQAAT